ncbi:MAG: hypothetical protein H6562_22955 [Lewinellaceae bacterium]|nr:hypothetical protein [Lewinella sp.]MCB9281768.1 hypothetical protein [Lewinellaceae bacterium]
MKTLQNKVIIYDDACPMCNAYTGCFVQFGWLERRTGFTAAGREILSRLDLDRSRHEIPLYDLKTGETLYGLNALFFILGNRYPWMNALFRNRLFRAFWKQVYLIVTYNRRIIAGTAAPKEGFDCAPDVHVFYRWVYIAIAVTAALIATVSATGTGAPAVLFYGMTGLHALFLVIGLFRFNRLDFTGHWATVAMVTTVLGASLPAVSATWIAMGILGAWLWKKRWRAVTGAARKRVSPSRAAALRY